MAVPNDPSAIPVVFASGVEGFKKSMGKRITPEILAEITALGISLEAPAAVPLSSWEKMIIAVGAKLQPGLSTQERHRLLGRTFMDGYVDTALGTTTLAMGRLIGARRTFLRMSRNFKTVANYLDCGAKELGEKTVELSTWMTEPFLSNHKSRTEVFVHYRLGVLERTLELLKEKGTVEITDQQPELQKATYLISWT